MNLVITGGGTGGHIFAGVAIAEEFKSRDARNDVLFVGSESGLETRLVPKAGFRLETLKLGKLVGQGMVARVLTLAQIPFAIMKSMRVLRAFKADLVVGVGGYAAGPCIVAARLLGIPCGVLEQNSVMGFTNKIAASLARKVFVAFNETPAGAPAAKCIVTGNPARSTLKPDRVKPDRPFVIFAFGGSQGAAGINKLMIDAAREFKTAGVDVKLIHQTGEREYEGVVKAYAELGYPAEVHKFIDNMQAMYNQACRSSFAGRAAARSPSWAPRETPRSSFPSLQAAANHQEVNARVVERSGGARVLLQGESRGSDLAAVIRTLMDDPAKLEAMREAMSRLYKPDAARRIVESMVETTMTSQAHV